VLLLQAIASAEASGNAQVAANAIAQAASGGECVKMLQASFSKTVLQNVTFS
jgi:hypothetical protein